MARPNPVRSVRRLASSIRVFLQRERDAARQGISAILLSSAGDLLAGLTLGAITHTLNELPGLLVLVPAAIGMRGNVFGALGSRLGTLIHTGQYQVSRRLDTPFGQNVAAALLLSISMSLALAVLARAAIGALGGESIGIGDLVVVSMIGAILSSVVVLAITLGVAVTSARRGWDLDNVAAPVVTAAGDMVTLPSLFVATYLVRIHGVTPALAGLLAVAAVVSVVVALRAKLPILHRIVVESFPVLLLAGTIDAVAGVTIEKRLETFVVFPALLVLVPPFLEDSGALGGILSARLASRLHLGTIDPGGPRLRTLGPEITLTYLFAIVVFFLVAVSANIVSAVFGLASPGVLRMMGISMVAGFFATTCAVMVAVGSAFGSFRLGLDPDNFGIPIVTSSLDLLGAGSLILAMVLFRVG
jgi:mgtE-like transporter